MMIQGITNDEIVFHLVANASSLISRIMRGEIKSLEIYKDVSIPRVGRIYQDDGFI
jgi:hypothetical protein